MILASGNLAPIPRSKNPIASAWPNHASESCGTGGLRFFAEHWGIVVIYGERAGRQYLDKVSSLFNVSAANQLEMLTLLFTADVYNANAGVRAMLAL
jgi:hypothetical protein